MRPRLLHAFSFPTLLLIAPMIRGQQTASINTLSINGPQILSAKDGAIRVVPIASGLYHPWSLAFTDAHTLLVTERNGRLRMIRDGALLPEPAWTSPTPPGESG